MTPFARWIAWNLLLAVIPVALGWLLAWGLSGRGKKRRLPLWVCLPLALLWLGFLPNTCYLLSEWRHIILDPHWEPILSAAHGRDNWAMLSLAKWALFFLTYSGAGVLLFVLAVRPIEQWMRASGRPMLLVAPFLFFATSLGVYLGLIVRLNTWDLWRRPEFVWDTARHALLYPPLLASIAVFAVVLWVVYEAVDLWVDGLVLRFKRTRPATAS